MFSDSLSAIEPCSTHFCGVKVQDLEAIQRGGAGQSDVRLALLKYPRQINLYALERLTLRFVD